MALSTLTLTATGRLPGALSGTPTNSTVVLINSGVVGIMPHRTSGFACYRLSCLGGLASNSGRIGFPANAGEASGTITTTSQTTWRFCSVDLERTSGTTVIAKGGGSVP